MHSETITIVISVVALVISIFALCSHVKSVKTLEKQNQLISEQNDALKKKKFTDDPHNVYSVNLEGINGSLREIADKVIGKDNNTGPNYS